MKKIKTGKIPLFLLLTGLLILIIADTFFINNQALFFGSLGWILIVCPLAGMISSIVTFVKGSRSGLILASKLLFLLGIMLVPPLVYLRRTWGFESGSVPHWVDLIILYWGVVPMLIWFGSIILYCIDVKKKRRQMVVESKEEKDKRKIFLFTFLGIACGILTIIFKAMLALHGVGSIYYFLPAILLSLILCHRAIKISAKIPLQSNKISYVAFIICLLWLCYYPANGYYRGMIGKIQMAKMKETFVGDSTGLKQTKVAATLDEPIEGGKNLIWCSSFQLAWNRLREDVIKEPVKFSDANETCDKLNKENKLEDDLKRDSYFSAAGTVGEGIIKKIQRGLSGKFPSETKPEFGNLPDEAIVAYAFLKANIKFEIPYFENDEPLVFTNSFGETTKVRSFGILEKHDYAYYELRKQIDVLYVTYSEGVATEEFVLDLCKDSKPYQIVAAQVQHQKTIKETLNYIEEKIKSQSDSPNEGFGDSDHILVPNMFWKITHHFKELEGQRLANKGHEGKPLEQAMQTIQFRLDRSGAELGSQAELFEAGGISDFYFNRPFLIYMKMRGGKEPFLVMWIDNAELLTKFENGSE